MDKISPESPDQPISHPILIELAQSTAADETSLKVELTLANAARAADIGELEIDASHLALSSHLQGSTTLLTPESLLRTSASFVAPIDEERAKSKFSPKASTLTIRAPMVPPICENYPKRLRLTVASLGRGTASMRIGPLSAVLNMHIAIERAKDGNEEIAALFNDSLVLKNDTPRHFYALVSRSGKFASPDDASSYTWCQCVTVRAAAARSTHLVITFDCSAWVWECPDALVTVGILREGMTRPSIEEGCEQVGVEFRVDQQPLPPPVYDAAAAMAQVKKAGGPAKAAIDPVNGGGLRLRPEHWTILGYPPWRHDEIPPFVAGEQKPLVSDPAKLDEAMNKKYPLEDPNDGAAPRNFKVVTMFRAEEYLLPTEALRVGCRLYNTCFASIDGNKISHDFTSSRPPPPTWSNGPNGNEVVDTYYASLTYGEAEFVPLFQLLSKVGVPDGCNVIDLGSGTGRMVLCAAIAFPKASRVKGVELVPTLHDAAVKTHAKLSTAASASDMPIAPVELLCGDVLEEEWSNADLVLMTSLCFPPNLVALLQQKARGLKPGAKLVCMQATFDEEDEDERGTVRYFKRVPMREEAPSHKWSMMMSFGEASFYVYERLQAPVGLS